ncbi:MAG: phosphoribosyl transferase [Pusillimonas sp.]|nr:phosphoribosyl transferase [Pusillimonas sp.]
MAHSLRWRDLRQQIMLRIPGNCPLCLTRTAAGLLCNGCCQSVCDSMLLGRARCAACALLLNSQGKCADCLYNAPVFQSVVAAFDYQFPGSVLILQFKQGKRYLLAAALAELLVPRLQDLKLTLPGATILVPVPASRLALQQRGFNPAGEIARHLSRRLHIPCSNVLFRRKETGPQKWAGRQQRYQQVRRLYGLKQSAALSGKHVWVVDDVLTTGSTLNAVSYLLTQAGAASVHGVVLARTPLSS